MARILPVARALGDGAVLVDVGSDDPGHVLAVARELRRLEGFQVADVVPAACTVLLVLDDDARVTETLLSAASDAAVRAQVASEPAASPAAAVLEVPTVYDGPDLADLAAWAGLAVADVVALHASATYVAAFVGFAPGFAYLRGVDPRLAAPRLASPRPRVPRGSVALAGSMTAVYPGESPGGWRLLGHTRLQFFDADRDPAALVTPGMRVRFIPVEAGP